MSGSRIRLVDAPKDKGHRDQAAGFRAGAELREARERLGWDLGEVAAALRIKLAYLQAIEDGRIAALPGNAYALGFLRTYATTLGLDADEISRRFRAEAGDVNRKTDLAFPAPVPERGVPTGALVLVGLLIAAAGYGAWYKLSDREQAPTHTVPAVPDNLLPTRRAAPVSPQVASVLPPPGTAVPTLPPRSVAPASPATVVAVPPDARVPATAVPPAPKPPAPVSPSTVPATTVPSTTLPSTAVPPTAVPPAANVAAPSGLLPSPAAPAALSTAAAPPPATPVPAAPAAALPQGVVLHANAVTWVQVRAADHHVVWDHVMQPGDTWPAPADTPGLTLTTGNAGGLTLSADGKMSPALGRNGSVRRSVSLDPLAVNAISMAPPDTAPAPPHVAVPHVHHPAPLPPAGSAADTADQLNARQLTH